MKSMCTKDGNRAGEGGGDDRTQLIAHGYEVGPEVFVDSGGTWGSFQGPSNLFLLIRRADARSQSPDHILTVYLSEVMQSIAHLAHCGPRWDTLFLSLTDIDTSRTDVCRSVTCGHFSL